MEGVREINVAQIKDMILKGDGCKVVLTVGEHLRTSSEKFFFRKSGRFNAPRHPTGAVCINRCPKVKRKSNICK